MLRSGALAVIVAIFIAAGTLGAAAMRERFRGVAPVTQASPFPAVAVTDSPTGVAPSPPPITAPLVVHGGVAGAAARMAPVVPVGTSTIGDGVTALRTDSGVTVSFDGVMTRTRIPEKFERLVRATLPAIYGAAANSALARLPVGGMVSQGDLITELPSRGITIPAGSTWTMHVYPETRPGRDGPLVVRYRVTVVATTR